MKQGDFIMSLVEKAESLAFMRLEEILKIIPISRSAWYRGVREGRFPRGCQLSDRTTGWRAAQIVELLEGMEEVQS